MNQNQRVKKWQLSFGISVASVALYDNKVAPLQCIQEGSEIRTEII